MAEADGGGSGSSGGGPFIASLVGAGGSLLSGLGSFFGGGDQGLSRDDQRYLAHHQVDMALRQEREGIQMRVRDAQAAGLHPLAALGISPSSASISQGIGSSGPSLGDRLSGLGQNISRAAAAVASPYERAAQAQALQTGELQNQLLQEQLIGARWENARQVGPPTPTSASQMMRNADGSVSRQPSQAWADANQNSFLARLEWMLSNKLMPNMPSGAVPPRRSTSTWRWGNR